MSLVVRGACKEYRPRRGEPVRALDRVDLEVADGELLVVVGPSGSGKTTLLRVIAGLESLDIGSVDIDGREVTTLPPGRRNVALVFQDYALFPHLTVAENISFGQRARGMAARDAVWRSEQAAATLNLDGLLRRYPGELSGGERQRVALARVLVREPDVLLLDEPLANLDAELRLQTRSQLRDLQRRLGVATCYVTHDQHEALALADRVAIMREGRIEQIATPAEAYERPATGYVARLLGALPMNLIPAKVVGGGPAEVLGVRPERVRLNAYQWDDSVRLTGKVLAIEPGGEESVLQVDVDSDYGDTRMLVRVPTAAAPQPGQVVALDWADTDVHWFLSPDGPRLDGIDAP